MVNFDWFFNVDFSNGNLIACITDANLGKKENQKKNLK